MRRIRVYQLATLIASCCAECDGETRAGNCRQSASPAIGRGLALLQVGGRVSSRDAQQTTKETLQYQPTRPKAVEPTKLHAADGINAVQPSQATAAAPRSVEFLQSAAEYLKQLGDKENPTPVTQGHIPMIALSGFVSMLVVSLVWFSPSKNDKDSGAAGLSLWMAPFFIGAWMSLSAGLTIFNKWLFVPTGGNFPRVCTLTWLHMFTAASLTQLLRVVSPDLLPAASKNSISKRQVLRQLVPISVLQTLVLSFGNTAYLYLSVSYIQMIKATMPAMIFVLSVVVGLEKFSATESSILVVLGIGAAGCSHGELQFSWIGLGFQLSGFFCEAWRLILLKLSLSQKTPQARSDALAPEETSSRVESEPFVPLDPLSALFYLAPLNLIALTLPMIWEVNQFPILQLYNLRYVLCANCLTAFGLNVAGVCLMSVASAVTFSICGLLKDFALIIGSTMIFHNTLTIEGMVSCVVVLLAAAIFQRQQQLKKA